MINFKNIFTFFIVISTSITVVKSQSTEELIELHKQNLKDLYQTRGAAPEWLQTGHVDDNYLSWCINHYSKKTAILIYSFKNDTLSINLFNQEQEKLIISKPITKENLIEHINNVNLYFLQKKKDKDPQLRGSEVKTKPKKILEESYELINEILLPKSFQLESYEHLIFVPVFNISTLPFAAFKIGEKYLIDYMSYSIAPSLFELMVSRKVNSSDYRSKKDSYLWHNALFVANPKYPTHPDWTFPNLPGTEKEINTITASLNPNTYTKLTGLDATKENVTKSICDYDLLYFATHGISNMQNPMEHSFLVLAESENSSSFLTLSEIMNTRKTCLLNADLVVLSACQTGLGKSHEGGIIGLARAFQIAGANHVVMSLWSIDDAETVTLMSYFFEELQKSYEMMPHEGLRQAILRYKSEVNSNPKYWAAFSIFGVPY